MFESQSERSPEFSLAVWFGHQAAALLVCPGAALFLSLFSSIFPVRWDERIYVILTCLAALPCGYLIPRSQSGLRAATMTWILPVVLFSCLLVGEVHHFGVARACAAFFSGHPGDDESLSTVLFTLPTWSSIAYSIGAAIKRYLS
jgi:hypothetical protein